MAFSSTLSPTESVPPQKPLVFYTSRAIMEQQPSSIIGNRHEDKSNRDGTLYRKDISVKVKTHDKDERYDLLTITLLFKVAATGGKILRVQLTNEADPFFLYFGEVGEAEFQSLKSDQKLLVEFSDFPKKYIELLEECTSSSFGNSSKLSSILSIDESSSPRSSVSNYRQIGVGGIQDAAFSIVEINEFKELTHLCLKLQKANDLTLKTYLAEQLQNFKSYCGELNHCVKMNETTLEKTIKDLEASELQLKAAEAKYTEQVKDLNASHKKNLFVIKEMQHEEIQSVKKAFEESKSSLEMQFYPKVEQLNKKLDRLQSQLVELTIKSNTLEALEKEARNESSLYFSEIKEKEKIILNLQSEVQASNRIASDGKQSIIEMESKLKGVREELMAKSSLLDTTSALNEELKQQKKSLEDQVYESKTHCDKLEEEVAASVKEITKGNTIITKLQTQLRSAKSKLATTLQAYQKKENRATEVETALEATSSINEELKKRADVAEEQLEAAKKEASSNKTLVEQLQMELTSTKEANAMLTKELANRNLENFLKQQYPLHSLSMPPPTKENLSMNEAYGVSPCYKPPFQDNLGALCQTPNKRKGAYENLNAHFSGLNGYEDGRGSSNTPGSKTIATFSGYRIEDSLSIKMPPIQADLKYLDTYSTHNIPSTAESTPRQYGFQGSRVTAHTQTASTPEKFTRVVKYVAPST